MAGMLPGVEAARRRRILTNNGGATASRRPSFCLYATNKQDYHFSSHAYAYTERNPTRCDDEDDEMLDAAAREAKNRLDLRLQKRGKKSRRVEVEGSGAADGRPKPEANLQTNFYKFIFKTAFLSC